MVRLFLLGAMLLVASSAFAGTFPSATCPDTMSILTLKTLLNTAQTCSPTTPNTTGTPGDTVLGVGGIVIGFDEIPTGFDIYLQMGVGGANTGIDCFTHGTNLRPSYGFNLGDSVVVEYASVANFNGDIEVEAPNNNFSNPNIVLRKVSSGNALPPILSGTTTDFKETPTNTYMLNHMSCLVRLLGPVTVARKTGLANGGMLVVRASAPSDSVFIDYFKLTTIVPPAVGTVLTSITGIVNNATRGFRIMPRSSADIVDVQPPAVTDAYAVGTGQYRIVFDRDVTPATAQNTANYSCASFGTVIGSVMDGTAAAIITVSGGAGDGTSETVTVNGITGVANGVTMTTPGSATFIAGALSCGQMSAPNPDSLSALPCRDVSNYVGFVTKTGQYTNGDFGPRSTVTGIVSGIFGNLYYMEDANPAVNRGITVFAPPSALLLGHKYILAGNDEEFYSENEFAGVSYVKDVGTPGVPAPVLLTVAVASLDTCDANQNITSGRDYLSDLVTLQSVGVVQRFPTLPTNGFHVAGPALAYGDTIFIENVNNALGANVSNNPNYPAVGTDVNIVGVVHYTTNTSTPSFRVAPRNAADITILGTLGVKNPGTAKLSFSVSPNPARTVTVAFTLPKNTNVQLGVYDIVGRRVATLATGPMMAGSYLKAWNGTDDAGNRVRTGMYFYRLNAGDEVRTARTVLITN
jgi:FlgD Ig-like domain